MSYATVYQCANDSSLVQRVTAAVADEGTPLTHLGSATAQIMWPIATATDVEAAYASAIAADNPDPGGDESVITDGMILGLVQANLPDLPAADEG